MPRKRSARPRLDPAPLLHMARLIAGPMSQNALAEYLDVQPRTMHRWVHEGATLSIERADELATMLGEHPVAIWPDWFLLPVDRETIGQDSLFDDGGVAA